MQTLDDFRLKPLTHRERIARFGRFEFGHDPIPRNPERIKHDPDWVRENLVTVPIPQLPGKKATLHKCVAGPFLDLFEAWEHAGLMGLVLTWNGSFARRFRRFRGTFEERLAKGATGTPKDLSNHAWGTAFDINAHWNRLGREPAAFDQTGTVLPLVRLAQEHGFAWGGYFRSRIDAMHFEYVGDAEDLVCGG